MAIHVGRRGAKLIPLPIGGFYTTDDPDALDVAVTPLSPEQQSTLQTQGLVFIPESRFDLDIDASQEPAQGNDYVVFGYSQSNSQFRIDRLVRKNIKQKSFTLHTGAAKAESTLSDIDFVSHLVLEFDRKQITVDGTRHNPPDPHGLSGGAAFHRAGSDVKLAGIMTALRRHPPVMIAVRMREVVAILEHVVES
jgi:hypothetical protein